MLELLPWRVVAVIVAAFAAAIGATALLVGAALLPAAVAGVIAGLFGSIFSDRTRALAGAGAALTAALLSVAAPAWATYAFIIPAIAGLVAVEADRSGSKGFVFALMAWIILLKPVSSIGGAGPSAVFAATAAFGIGVAILLGAEARVPARKPPAGYGLSLGIAMAIGLALAFAIAAAFEGSHTQWIALMFAARGLDAPDQHRGKAVRTGIGAMAGAATAGAALTLPLPAAAFSAAGLVLFVLGLRIMPNRSPLSPALISAAVILGTAPDQASAVFRVEAAAIAAGLAVGLTWAAEALRRALSARRATIRNRDTGGEGR